MKGFYFSLDALTASTVLLAAAMMVVLYQPAPHSPEKPEELGLLHSASMQDAQDWNSSLREGTALENIYTEYFRDKSKAESICDNYFQGRYALFLVNKTDRLKACGGLNINKVENIRTESTIIADKPVNQKSKGPYKAVMVMPD